MNDRDERLIDLLYGDADKSSEGVEETERAELDALRRTRDVARALPPKSPSARVSAAILAEARAAASARTAERPAEAPAAAAAPAAPAVVRKPVAESSGGVGGFLRWLLRPGPAAGLVLVAAALMIVVVRKGDKLTEVAPAADQAPPTAAAPAVVATPAEPRLEAVPAPKVAGLENTKDAEDVARLDRRARAMAKPTMPAAEVALGGGRAAGPSGVSGGLGAARGEGKLGLSEKAEKRSKGDYGLADKAADPAFAPPPPPREPKKEEAKREEAKPEEPAKEAFAGKAKAAAEPKEAERPSADEGRAEKNLGKKGYVAPPADDDSDNLRTGSKASKSPYRAAPAGAAQHGGAVANQAPAPNAAPAAPAPATTRSADVPAPKQAREESNQRKDLGADNNLARQRPAKKRAVGDNNNVTDELEAPRMAEQRGNASTQHLQNQQRTRDNVDHCARLSGEPRFDCLAGEGRCEEADRELTRLPHGGEARERLRKRIDACRVQREEDAVAERQQRRRGPAAASKAKAKRAPAAAAEKAADKADAMH